MTERPKPWRPKEWCPLARGVAELFALSREPSGVVPASLLLREMGVQRLEEPGGESPTLEVRCDRLRGSRDLEVVRRSVHHVHRHRTGELHERQIVRDDGHVSREHEHGVVCQNAAAAKVNVGRVLQDDALPPRWRLWHPEL